MSSQFDRILPIFGEEGLKKLHQTKIILFGVGGVGSFTAEALVRCGVGSLTIVDKDVVDITNINRQLIATHETLGLPKVEVCGKRLKNINPKVQIIALKKQYLPENAADFYLKDYDYVIDAIDMITAKISLIVECHRQGIKIISSMGTGNKLDPTAFEVTDIYKTSVCPLAKVMRYELKKRGVEKQKVLYSKEQPVLKMTPPASVPFVPSVAGLILAGEVIKEIVFE